MKTKIISEAGVNHNGNIKLAFKLIDVANSSGADYVKFQSFKADRLCTPSAVTSPYISDAFEEGEDFRGLLKRLELSYQDHVELKAYCDEVGIGFMSTAFDVESLDMLVHLGIDTIKIASGDITDVVLLTAASKYGLPIILSTGMASGKEIDRALDILGDDITLLHCVSLYPTKLKDLHLSVMKYCQGLSDHTTSLISGAVAVGMGAKVIEKHFTTDKTLAGPDHSFSLDPRELKVYIQNIRDTELMLGSAVDDVLEAQQRKVHRKSIVAQQDIDKGEQFTMNNLTLKRPGTGIEPYHLDRVLGKTATRTLKKDTLLTESDII